MSPCHRAQPSPQYLQSFLTRRIRKTVFRGFCPISLDFRDRLNSTRKKFLLALDVSHVMSTICPASSRSGDTGTATKFGCTEHIVWGNGESYLKTPLHGFRSAQIHLYCPSVCFRGFTLKSIHIYIPENYCVESSAQQSFTSVHQFSSAARFIYNGTISHRTRPQRPRWSRARVPFRRHRRRQRPQGPNQKRESRESHAREIRV